MKFISLKAQAGSSKGCMIKFNSYFSAVVLLFAKCQALSQRQFQQKVGQVIFGTYEGTNLRIAKGIPLVVREAAKLTQPDHIPGGR